MNNGDTIVVLIAGGHAAGKQSGANILASQLHDKFSDEMINITKLNMQDYMTASDNGSRLPSQFNFDKLKSNLDDLMNNEKVDVIIVYGLYSLYDDRIVDLATVRVFIDCDADIRLGRWIKRDVLVDYTGKSENEIADLKLQEKKKLDKLLNIYLNHSRFEMRLYIQNTKEKADVILPRGADVSGLLLIVDGVQSILFKKFIEFSGAQTDRSMSTSSTNRESVIHNMKLLAHEPSVRSLNNDNFSNQNKIYYDVN